MITVKQTSNYMHNAKKLFLLLMAVSFSCALWAQSGKTGNLRWNLSSDGTLTISGSGVMPDYESPNEFWNKKSPWHKYSEKIKKVIIDKGVTSIGDFAFYCCDSLTSVTIPNGIASIGEYAFFATKLTSVTIPNSLTSIGDFAFRFTWLTSVIIPESVTNIGEMAFSSNNNLTSVTILGNPSISSGAFDDCKKLSDITVYLKNPNQIYNSNSRFLCFNCYKSATLHVPAGTKSHYQQAEGWKYFKIVEYNSLIDIENLPIIDWSLASYSIANKKEFNINARIKSKTQTEVSIFVNEQITRGINVVQNDGYDRTINQNIDLVEGSNTIKMQVKNAAGVKEEERVVNYIIPKPPISVGKRYALVIGNANYTIKPLKNSVNDAIDIEAKLKQLGFTTVLVENATKEKMEYAIRDIALKANGYEAVMFFYSGHAIQYEGKNYLLPVNVNLQTPSDISYCVDMDLVLGKMEDSGCGMKIVVLDACRNNPFPSWTKGVGRDGLTGMDAPSGTFIAYAAAKGKVAQDGTGRNSPYTEEFLKMLNIPRLNIFDFFQELGDSVKLKTNELQIPWTENSFSGKFYFNNK
ncbi:MAG: leucine-rich repeat protein [Paludibacter sp.]|nr:leucine-rich repeat protein [Paludibacter sp.]